MIIDRLSFRKTSEIVGRKHAQRPIPILTNDESSESSSASFDTREVAAVTDRRRARFDLTRNAEYENNSLYDKEDIAKMDTWYTKDDYARFKAEARTVVKNAKKQRLRREGGTSARSDASEYIGLMEYIYQLCGSKQQSMMENIGLHSMESSSGIELLGLEMLMLPDANASRKSRRSEIRKIVLAHQPQDGNDEDNFERDDALCQQCRRVSRPAKMYAGVVAKVLWLAREGN